MKLRYSAHMPATTLAPLITLELLKPFIWFIAGMLLQAGVWFWQRQHNKPHDTLHSVAILLLLIFYWYNFLTVIYPNTIMPEILLPTTLFCSVIIIVLVAVQHFVAARWKKILSFWSMGIALLLQLIIFMQPNTVSLPLALQLFLAGMIVAQMVIQVRSILTWLQ